MCQLEGQAYMRKLSPLPFSTTECLMGRKTRRKCATAPHEIGKWGKSSHSSVKLFFIYGVQEEEVQEYS